MKILIIDEQSFSRVCSVILEGAGYQVQTMMNTELLPSMFDNKEIGLIITSYPYGCFLFDEMKKRRIPVIILANDLDGRLVDMLHGLYNAACMIKPLDYGKFRSLVKQMLSGKFLQAGYSVV